jgi:hypothetical protein
MSSEDGSAKASGDGEKEGGVGVFNESTLAVGTEAADKLLEASKAGFAGSGGVHKLVALPTMWFGSEPQFEPSLQGKADSVPSSG